MAKLPDAAWQGGSFHLMLGAIRDIAIIVVAVLDIVLLVILIVLAFVLYRIATFLRAEIAPIVWSAKRTATTVEGSVDFAATTAVNPMIRAVSFLFAISRFFGVLFGRTERQEVER